MISDERLRIAADRASGLYVAHLEQGYDPANQHIFPAEFERKIRKLKCRADHPLFYRTMQRAASIALAILITGGAFLSVNVEARAALIGWIKEVYETVFVYRFSGETIVDAPESKPHYEPTWIPSGYTKYKESDLGGKITVAYQNENEQRLKVHYIYDPNITDFGIDATDATTAEAKIGAYKAELILFDNSSMANHILWTDKDKCVFLISGYLVEEDLVRMAKSLYENK